MSDLVERAASAALDVRQSDNADVLKLRGLVLELAAEIERLRERHCDDCCCAQAWEALGIKDYTGKSIPEHIRALRERLEKAADLKALIDEGFLVRSIEGDAEQGWALKILPKLQRLAEALRALDGEGE